MHVWAQVQMYSVAHSVETHVPSRIRNPMLASAQSVCSASTLLVLVTAVLMGLCGPSCQRDGAVSTPSPRPMLSGNDDNSGAIVRVGYEPPSDCLNDFSDLKVTSSALKRQRQYPRTNIVSDVGMTTAEYSGDWAETRVVHISSASNGITVRADLRTDHGDYRCDVDLESSHAYVLGESAVCLDLSVVPSSTPYIIERWQCRLVLP